MLVDTLGEAANHAFIVFRSDHGEYYLGAHGRPEERIHFSKKPQEFLFSWHSQERLSVCNTEVNKLVSHLDIFSTILDYAGATEAENSDGKS
jgi:arylsulfatase A-like enzyme